jgi:hypothetical protein
MSAMARIEHAILEILKTHSAGEVPGRELRTLLSTRGFRRSAPAFVFTMMKLADKGLVTCREEVLVVCGVEVRDRYYRLANG